MPPPRQNGAEGMALIRPYHIFCERPEEWDQPLRLVYGVSGKAAAAAVVRYFGKNRSRAKITERLEEGGYRGAVVKPYRVNHMWRGGIRQSWLLFAKNADAAKNQMSTSHVVKFIDLFAEEVDDLEVLLGMPQDEIEVLNRLIWSGRGITTPKMTGGLIEKRNPIVGRKAATGSLKFMRTSPKKKDIPSSKALAAYAIRLATLLPWFGPPANDTKRGGPPWVDIHHGHEKGEFHRQLSKRDRRRWAMGRHGENAPHDLIEGCIHVGLGDMVEPFTKQQREALYALAGAYGYNVEGMDSFDLVMLWNCGTEGLEKWQRVWKGME